MPTTATRIETELLEQEKRFWEASKGDAAGLRELCADEFTFLMNDGISNFTRDDFVNMITNGDYHLKSYDLDGRSVVVRELGPDAATIAYRAKSAFTMKGDDDRADSYYTSTWVRDGGAWRCAFVTESIAEGGA